ncbi:MAG: hypothetical protein AABY22_10540, partial [Nanoarchaeota archaeon]
MQKKGISQSVVVIILILLVLVAIGIIAIVYFNIINESSVGVESSSFTTSLGIVPASVSLLDSDGNGIADNISLVVKRNPGAGELSAIQFVISSANDS